MSTYQKYPQGYYVYAYIRKSNLTPYYIGKGKNNRAWQKHKRIPVPADTRNIIILESNLTELGALALERRLIRWWGRKDIGTGILRNKTDGGDGLSGHKASAELKKYFSESRKGMNNNMFGRKHSEAVRIASSIRRSKTNSLRRWYNNGIESKFLKEPLGPEWVRGRINQKPTTTGNKWYNNGIVNISSKENPEGSDWVEGMLPKKTDNKK